MLITENNRKHYVAIISLSRLLFSQNTKHKRKEYFCMNCLQVFNEESSRDEHLDYCINNKSVKIEMSHRNLIVQWAFPFLSVQGDGRKKFKSIFALDFFYMNILPPGKQLGKFSVSLEFYSELPGIFASFVLSKCQWM